MLDYKKCLFYGVILLQHGESHNEQIEVNNEQDLGRNCSASCGEWSLSHKSFRSYYSDLLINNIFPKKKGHGLVSAHNLRDSWPVVKIIC